MIISRSESRNSRTKFRLDFDEKTSKSCSCQPELSAKFSHRTYLDDIDMLQLAQVLHFAYGGHVEAVFELPDLDLLYGASPFAGRFSSYATMIRYPTQECARRY